MHTHTDSLKYVEKDTCRIFSVVAVAAIYVRVCVCGEGGSCVVWQRC